jgi:hypothetical protein
MPDDIDPADQLHRVYHVLNAWEATPLVALFFLGLSVPFVVLVGRPAWYMVWASLAATGVYVFVALRDLERDEPIGVLDEENQ